jgi:hypothetical protein
MNYYYLTDESEKSVAPFFAKQVLQAGMAGVVIVGAFLVVFWPRQPLAGFMLANNSPTIFFLVFAATLIVHCYVNLCCGAGDMIRKGYHIISYKTDKPTYEMEFSFYRYGLIEFLLHTLILLLPFLPILSLAGFISAISLITFLMALSILFTMSLLCRMSGFLVYLFWGRSSTIGYFAARAMMIFFIFATILFAPSINPLHLLYLLNQSSNGAGYAFMVYMVAVTLAIFMLIFTNNALVRRHINKNSRSEVQE